MNPEDIVKILDELSNRLTPASQAAWNIMLAQVSISSWFAIVAGTIIAIAGFVLQVAIWRSTAEDRKNPSSYISDDAWTGAILLSTLAGLFTVIPSVALLYNGVLGVVVPEWHILNEFLNILGG